MIVERLSASSVNLLNSTLNAMDILTEIIGFKKTELAERKQFVPPSRMSELVAPMLHHKPSSMKSALLASPTGIIAEFKRHSPSKGWIKKDGKASVIPLAYQRHGASALSILTDTQFFGGYDEYVQEAVESGVEIPILYKNFVIDDYQLFQARYCGASAVLLIAAALEKDDCRRLIHNAHQLGLEVLLEMHNERDLDYADLEPDIYGINNRNLGSFVTDVTNSFRLAEKLPKDVCKVSESGISQPSTVSELRQLGFRGFLMGEHFMRADAPGEALAAFIAELQQQNS